MFYFACRSADTKIFHNSNVNFGGPGVGDGGAMGSPYANDKARGKILVISSNGDALKPDANYYGGMIAFSFRMPTNIDSFGIIMANYRTSVEVITADGGKRHLIEFYGKYYNSYWLVPIKIPNVVQLIYRPQSISGITHINFSPEKEKCPVSKRIDFASFKPGSMVSTLPDGTTVWTTRSLSNNNNNTDRRPALVLDTLKPSEPDFGAPHNSVGGPGWGQDGKLGMPFENIQTQGNVLVVGSGDRTTLAFRAGGTIVFQFVQSAAVYISSIGLLNNVKGAMIRAKTEYRNSTYTEEYQTNLGGRNSFQEVFLWTPNTRELAIRFDGPGAVTFVKLGTCITL
jgi:hypothetical protein